MSYSRVSSAKFSACSSQGSSRGFRLNPRKVYVFRLRKRFNCFLRLFDNLKLSYFDALQLLKKVVWRRGSFRRNNSSKRSLVREEQIIKGQADCRMRSSYYGRSNSFYAEAIADCLEFIKRTSSIPSKDQIQDPINHFQDRNT